MIADAPWSAYVEAIAAGQAPSRPQGPAGSVCERTACGRARPPFQHVHTGRRYCTRCARRINEAAAAALCQLEVRVP